MAGLAHTADRSHIELRDVSKHFGGVRALDSVSLAIARGSVHALVGENGAGKSTLGKIVAGVHTADAGDVLLDGEPVVFRSPREALDQRIAAIAQEPSIVPQLTVAENVLLGDEPRRAGFVDRRALGRRFRVLAKDAGFELDGSMISAGLRTAEQQKIEILRALSRDAQVIVMDEPTAALNRPETEALHAQIRALAQSGKTIILISHFLDEVIALADTVTVLRDGRIVRTAPTAQETSASLIEAMLGRPLDAAFPDRRTAAPDAPVVLSVRNLSAHGVSGASFDVRAGEIVGLAGLVGAGRTELALAIAGAARSRTGTVELNGTRLAGGPRSRLRAGLAMIPESRKDSGLIMGRSVAENVSLSRIDRFGRMGFVRRGMERREVAEVLSRCDVRAASAAAGVDTLSGGNQQKVLFARILLCGSSVVIADEPTRGVDVGAKRAIYDILVDLADRGHGVLLISSELEEILGLSERVLVMRRGRIVREVGGDDMTEATILNAAFADAEVNGEAP
jgi:ABC-type sugar transport system ATPase subunit